MILRTVARLLGLRAPTDEQIAAMWVHFDAAVAAGEA